MSSGCLLPENFCEKQCKDCKTKKQKAINIQQQYTYNIMNYNLAF